MLHRRELRNRLDLPNFELVAVLAADSGDKRKMTVVAAAPVAFAEPAADVAMQARLGVGGAAMAVVGRFFEALFDVAVISGIFGDAILLGRSFFAGRNDPHEFGEVAVGWDLRC